MWTPIDIIALFFVILVLVKLLVVSYNKRIWIEKITKPIYNNQKITGIIVTGLALLILKYLLEELSLVQIFAVVFFSSLLIVLGFLPYSKELMNLIEKVEKRKFTKWQIFYLLVWLFFALWVFYEIIKRI